MRGGLARIGRIAAAAGLALAAPLLAGGTGRLDHLDARLLAAHNRERDALGLAPLAWDAGLARDAAAWAAELARRGEIEHEEEVGDADTSEGENLWQGTTGGFAPEAMVGLWIAEKKDFRPGPIPAVSRTGRFEDVGHYTQLVWRATDRVGCALARGARDEMLVCRYRTAGNVEGERPF
ncbi:MAG: SCP-like extracellular [Alphaproteobacteria bacterium]|nr:SCP-like extracellular [Alphaproteobacteria bacterium]